MYECNSSGITMQIYGEYQFRFYPGTQLDLSLCGWGFVKVGIQFGENGIYR